MFNRVSVTTRLSLLVVAISPFSTLAMLSPAPASACSPISVTNPPGGSQLAVFGASTPANQHSASLDVVGYTLSGAAGKVKAVIKLAANPTDDKLLMNASYSV